MEITVAKKLEFVMMAFVIMAAHLRCATGNADCGNILPLLIDLDEQEVEMYSESDFTISDMYDLMGTAYPFAFETEKAAKQRTGIEFEGYMDGDTCCKTWHNFTYTKGALEDVNNENCYIIGRPNYRQYYEIGMCEIGGSCGNCVQQYKIQALIAWCPESWGIKKHNFRVRSYCTCQANT